MEPTIVRKSSFQIIGLQFRGNNDNNACPKLWDKFLPRMVEVQPFAIEPITAFGVCSDFDVKENSFTYTVGFEVNDVSAVPTDMVTMEIPPQEYAVFECTLPSIIKTIEVIYKQWIPKSEYNRASGPEFELYDAEFDPEIPDSKMFLYIPVIKK